MNDDQNTCGCCEEEKILTPAVTVNLPGLKNLAFRIGTHGSFKAQMKSDLSRKKTLIELTSREDDDPSFALIDAWACVLDVLTFYQERIANEGYLPTATERLSVLNLAKAIGYELKPGVAASTFLAFTLDEAAGSPGEARIDKGTKVMSIPGQDEKPQTFETIESIDAYASWNTLKPKLTRPRLPVFKDKEIYLKGVMTGLKPGDGLLIIGKERLDSPKNENWDFRRVKTISTDIEGNYTTVTWEKGLGWTMFNRQILPAKKDVRIYALRQRAALFGYNAPDWHAMPDDLRDGYIKANGTSTNATNYRGYDNWPDFTISSNFSSEFDYSIYLDALYPQITEDSWIVLSNPDYEEVYKVSGVEESSITNYTLTSKSTHLKLSGENLKEEFDDKIRETIVFAKSEELEIAQEPLIDPVQKDTITLDRALTGLNKDKTLIISGKRIRAVIKSTKKGMNLISLDDPASSKEIDVGDSFYVLDPPTCNDDGNLEWHLMDRKNFVGRIIEESKEIVLAKGAKQAKIMSDGLLLISDDWSKFVSLKKDAVLDVLDDPPFEYVNGQIVWHLKYKGTGKPIDGHVAVSSDRIVLSPAEKEDPVISEVVSVVSVFEDKCCDVLKLNVPLDNAYDRKTVVIYGNVVRATHGETKTEVLGNGDASKAFQKFILKQKPLTYISSSSADGTQSTLAVHVNDILWDEVRSLYGINRKNRVFITSLADDGTVTIKFGDGKTGARLPTGSENVTATYRVGTGMQGMVKAGQLSLLLSRPLGVQGVINPLAPAGADDPEKLENARKNAPMKVLTLDRVVSLSDFEDFTRAFSGIGKASAVWLWGGGIRYVHITIASADEKGVDDTSDLYKNLWKAIDESKDPVVQFRIDTFTPLSFDISARILVNEKYISDKVFAAVKDALNNAFSFPKRNFGQPVTESEINAVIQGVEGVVAVDLDEDALGKIPDVNNARLENNTVKRAELLTINPDGIDLSEMKL
jgi:hypothetical protein